MSFYHQYYIDYDENSGANYVKFWQAVLKLACEVIYHLNLHVHGFSKL